MTQVIFNNEKVMRVLGAALQENVELKRQIKEQQEIIENIELQELSKEVAVYLDEWLDEPIPKHLSEAQDSKLFAYRMTKFIKQKLRN